MITVSEKIQIKKGFQTPISITVTDEKNQPVDLSAFDAVKFTMVDMNGTAKINDQTATFIDKPTGQIGYTPTANDVNIVGKYRAYFSLSTSSVKKLSAPTDYFEIEIVSDLIS